MVGGTGRMNEYMTLFRKAENALRRVIIPGYDVDLVSSGVVKRMRLSYDKKKLAVFLDYSGSDPSCMFCRFINLQIWNRILRDARDKLAKAGFEDVVFYDWATGDKLD